MRNPFEEIAVRLSTIETLLLELKNKDNPAIQREVVKAENFMNVDEVAKFLNLSKPTIYSKVSKREIPSMKRGNRLYFSKDEMREYIEKGTRKTDAEINSEADNYINK